VLKVMSREGNTLSPVIRSAWDDGNLRILTKTSPAHATDAHISIIGHITRGESRRNLLRQNRPTDSEIAYCGWQRVAVNVCPKVVTPCLWQT
jgi:hypothetical protein